MTLENLNLSCQLYQHGNLINLENFGLKQIWEKSNDYISYTSGTVEIGSLPWGNIGISWTVSYAGILHSI